MSDNHVAGPRRRVRATFDWIFRNRRTGRVTVAQIPNTNLGIYLTASIIRRLVLMISLVSR